MAKDINISIPGPREFVFAGKKLLVAMKDGVAGLWIIYLQEHTVVRPAESYVEFSTHCVENLREGFIELRKVIKISLGKAVAILSLQLFRQADDDFSAIFCPVVSFENLFTDSLSQEPVTLNERHIDRGVGVLSGTVDDGAGVCEEVSAAGIMNDRIESICLIIGGSGCCICGHRGGLDPSAGDFFYVT